MAGSDEDKNSSRKIAPNFSVIKGQVLDKHSHSPGFGKITVEDSGYKRLKLCKRGYREVSAQWVCGMIFEGLPVWLWSLRLSDWSLIYVSVEDEKMLKADHPKTWDFAQDRISSVSKETLENLVDVDLWFVSGSMSALERVDSFTGAKAFWLSTGGRRKPKLWVNSGWQWLSVVHSRVGGTTTSGGMFGLKGIKEISIPHDPIRRSIGHIIKYSEKPRPCSIPPQTEHFTVDQLLSVHHLDRPVLFSSGFSRTGWGMRPLVEQELTQAFDLPSFLAWDDRFPRSMLPLELFRVVIEAVLDELRLAEEGFEPKILKTNHGINKLEAFALRGDDSVWLPAIGKWLPGSWADAPIADKAVKSDNAAVDFSPWHNRIKLVLPCPAGTLESMEAFGIRWWRRRICASFVSHLRARYGDHWSQTAALMARREGKSVSSGKRRKVLTGYCRQNTEGGVRIVRIFSPRVGSGFGKRASDSQSSAGEYLVGMDLRFVIILLEVERYGTATSSKRRDEKLRSEQPACGPKVEKGQDESASARARCWEARGNAQPTLPRRGSCVELLGFLSGSKGRLRYQSCI